MKKERSAVDAKVLQAQCTTKAKQLEQINLLMEDMPTDEILPLITWEEQKMIDRLLFAIVRMVNKVDVASGSSVDVPALVSSSKVKFPGCEARTFLFEGGFESGLQVMNLIAINAKVQNRELLNSHLKIISKLEKKNEHVERAIKDTVQKLAELRDPSTEVVNKYASKIKLQQDTKVGAEDDFESFSVENVCSDVISSLDALEQYEVDISAVRDDIIKASYDAVLLYSGNSDIQLDPVAAAIETVFVKLKALMLPIVFALFDDVPEMIAVLKHHG